MIFSFKIITASIHPFICVREGRSERHEGQRRTCYQVDPGDRTQVAREQQVT